MFLTFVSKEWKLTSRNSFYWMVVLFPVLFAWAILALSQMYAPYPKIVVLAGQSPQDTWPQAVTVLPVGDLDALKERVSDIDDAIGWLPDGTWLTDGREDPDTVAQVQALVTGAQAAPAPSASAASPFLAFALYNTFFAGSILLFRLVEEREFHTLELLQVQPVPRWMPYAAKAALSVVLSLASYAATLLILRPPMTLVQALWLFVAGTSFSLLLGTFTAYSARSQAQAIALLKPVVFLLAVLLPALGLFVGGFMHTIALADPFYWLLQACLAGYTGEPSAGWLAKLGGVSAAGFLLVRYTWHRSPYGIPKAR